MKPLKSAGFLFQVILIGFSIAAAGKPNDSTNGTKPIWLSDLPERNVKVGWGKFGKNGWAGFESYPISISSMGTLHGLGTHPDCHVEYVLGKKYRMFRGTAAMDDSADVKCDWPIEYRILGDGKMLWKSFGICGRSAAQPCMIDITGVDVLRLEVVYRPGEKGTKGNAHAVWIDPYVTVDPPRPEVMAYFDPHCFERLKARTTFILHVLDLLKKDDFDQLETIATQHRAKDDYWGGYPALGEFYDLLRNPSATDEASWQKHFARLERWKEAKPDSMTPLTVLGCSYITYGWQARGNGYANTVTPEGAEALEKRLAKAREYLQEAMKKKEQDPEAYLAMMQVELVRSESRDETLKYFDQARKISPRYYGLYSTLANYLLPKWHGQPGDVEKYAEKLRKEIGGELGDEVYFRMACLVHSESGGDGFFRETDFGYDNLLPGMKITLRDYPESRTLYNDCCHFACLAGDKELALQLLPRLDVATYWEQLWHGHGMLEYYRRKFDPQSHEDDKSRTLYDHIGMLMSIAYLKDGTILAGGQYPRVELWDPDSDKPIDTLPIEGQVGMLAVDSAAKQMIVSVGKAQYAGSTSFLYALGTNAPPQALQGHKGGVVSVAISPDGTFCVTGARDDTARIWKLSDIANPIVISHPEWVYDVACSSDGKTIATSSVKGGVWLWDAATGKAEGAPLVDVQKGPWECRVRFSPDGKELVTASADGTIRRWDLATRKFDQVKTPGGWLECLEISPNGKWIAVGRIKGRVDLLDIKTLKTALELREHLDVCYGLAFSADTLTLASCSTDGSIKLWPISKLLPHEAEKEVVEPKSAPTK